VTVHPTKDAESIPGAASRRRKDHVRRVAVVAHQRKTLGGGLDELRSLISAEHHGKLLWYEVPKSRQAPAKVRKAIKRGADLLFVWGGDGMVQRCADALVGSETTVAIVPAGTANLFAHNLGIPEDVAEAVRIGLYGQRRKLDLGWFNGEHFAVLAGVGFDANLIRETDRGLKARVGRLGYLWTGARNAGMTPVPAKVKVDGATWFKGETTCVLVGNVGTVLGGVQLFDDARPDDARLEVGVSTADGPLQWARLLAHVSAGSADRSPLIRTSRGKRISVKLSRPTAYEIDGGARPKTKRIKAHVVPSAITVCVPRR
jgi:YegS/Rv2252/BmrU family lipid kinase